MKEKEGGFCDIHYKTGIFSSDVDRDIPIEFIKWINPPETPIKEGIVRVFPFTIGKPTYFRLWDTYKELIVMYETNFQLLEAHLDNLKEFMQTKVDRHRMLEELDSITKVVARLYENLKVKKPEVATFALEKPEAPPAKKEGEKAKT